VEKNQRCSQEVCLGKANAELGGAIPDDRKLAQRSVLVGAPKWERDTEHLERQTFENVL